jgi:hypothetical protein
MKFLLTIFFLISAYASSEAQTSNTFFVFNIKGSGYYMRDKYKIPLKIGTSLSINDVLTLSLNTEVKIICNSYSLFTIAANKTSLNASIKDYTNSCKAETKSVTLNILKYLWVHFEAAEKTDPNAENNNNLQEYGGIVRGCADSSFNNLPDISVYQKTIAIKYHPLDQSGKYIFKIFANATGGFPIAQIPLENDRFVLTDKIFEKLTADNNYYFTISKNGIEYCSRKLFKKLSDISVTAIINNAKTSNNYGELSINEKNFLTGFFLEKNNLLAEASYYYSEAIKANSSNSLALQNKNNLDAIIDFK